MLIQKRVHHDSVIASQRLVVEFCNTIEVKADESQVGMLASFFARWSRDPAAKLCLRRATLILRAQYAPKLSLARGSDSARRPAWGPQLASFLALSPPKLRLHLFRPRRGESGSLFCGRSERAR